MREQNVSTVTSTDLTWLSDESQAYWSENVGQSTVANTISEITVVIHHTRYVEGIIMITENWVQYGKVKVNVDFYSTSS